MPTRPAAYVCLGTEESQCEDPATAGCVIDGEILLRGRGAERLVWHSAQPAATPSRLPWGTPSASSRWSG